jgi:dTDP-4-dehydrorhamnose reductase
VTDTYFSQMERNGHRERLEDIDRFASLGISAIRYPVLWECTAPDGIEDADWSWADARLPRLRELGVEPIAGLIHHGSGPQHTSLVDPDFAEKLAAYAGAVAARYPWLTYYTPVNEPLTTARFSGLAGVWYPHGSDESTFVRALLNQCRAVVLSMQAIRAVNPEAKLVQTDDLSRTYGTPEMGEIVEFFNERRWLSWDLLCGKVDPSHALWDYLLEAGASAEELLWFRDHPCPPDVIGVNYYITSERWLDHRVERYPASHVHTYRGIRHADMETARVLANPTPGIGPLLMEVWERYRLPVAITEAHIDANREDQLRWLLEVWKAAQSARDAGADMRAVTVWALLGSYDWNCLVTACKGYYEPGPFDVRGPEPRPTAVATMMRALASGAPLRHPVLQGAGWWHRPGRFLCPPVATSATVAALPAERNLAHRPVQPILISGATGTLGSAFARICEERNLAFKVLTRQEMDIADPASVEAAVRLHRPWAIINAGGFVRVHDAEHESDRCLRENAHGPVVLANACARHGIRLLSFSSDLVFDGTKGAAYVESDPVAPLNVYGQSKAEAERRVLAVNPDVLMVRTSAFFGPWDRHNFVTLALQALQEGRAFTAASDLVVSPTYVPDLVQTCLDLLIDNERGIWHLSSGEAVSWADLARRVCTLAGLDEALVDARPATALEGQAPQPRYSALGSERGKLMPALDDALQRYLQAVEEVRRQGDTHVGAAQAAHYGSL